jgi:hypothetical protein
MAVTKSKIGYSEGVHPLMVGRTQQCCSKCSEFAYRPGYIKFPTHTGINSACPSRPLSRMWFKSLYISLTCC